LQEEITEGQPFDVIRGNPKHTVVTIKYRIPFNDTDHAMLKSAKKENRFSDIENFCLRYIPTIEVEKI